MDTGWDVAYAVFSVISCVVVVLLMVYSVVDWMDPGGEWNQGLVTLVVTGLILWFLYALLGF